MDASSAPDGRAARLVAVLCLLAAVGFSALAELHGGGWGLLILGPVYLIVLIAHLVTQLKALGGQVSARLFATLLLGDACLVGAFLLQCDSGDGESWLIVKTLWASPGTPEALAPAGWPCGASVLLFVPWLLAWLVTALQLRGPARGIWHGPPGAPGETW